MPRFMKKEFYHYGRKAGLLAVLFALSGYLNQTVMAKEQGRGEESLLSVSQIATLAQKLHPDLKESAGWAEDIGGALKDHDLPISRKNVCTIMAIIKLESGFEADPQRVNLGTKAITALHKRLQKLPKGVRGKMVRWLINNPDPKHSYYDRLLKAKNERALDMTYRHLVGLLLGGKIAPLQKVSLVGRWIERFNAIDTIGAMQISVAFAVRAEEKRLKRRLKLPEVWQLRDRLYSRKGGLHFGVLHLLGHNPGDADVRYRFADYLAGFYASRNAAFQKLISELLNEKLVLDGDLLRYRKSGKRTFRRSNTEKAVRRVAKKYKLKLGLLRIRADLAKEKQASFTATQTWQKLRVLYQKTRGTPAPFIMMPQSKIQADKTISYSTTAQYAQKAKETFGACMAGL